MKTKAIARLLVSTAVLALSVGAQATPTPVDQSQTSVNTGVPFVFSPGDTDYPVGQSFTAGVSGLLADINLETNGPILTSSGAQGGSDMVTLQIRAGNGVTGALLGSETISVSNLNSSLWFDMNTSSLDIDVVKGQQYTFDITSVTGSGDLATRGVLASNNNPYAGGQAYAAGYGNPANEDLVFQTEVSTGNVPEPASIALAAVALCGLAAVRRKRA